MKIFNYYVLLYRDPFNKIEWLPYTYLGRRYYEFGWLVWLISVERRKRNNSNE